MPYTLNLSFVLPDTVSRDLTRFRLTQRVGSTTLAASTDNVTTTLTVNNVPLALVAGVQILVDNEIMTVTAVSGTTITVTRGADTFLTASTPSTAAAAHAAGAMVSILMYPSLETMGLATAQADAQKKILALGAQSETLSSLLTASS